MKIETSVFTSNIFSPYSGQEINKHFVLATGSPFFVVEAMIFDRWGNQVYSIINSDVPEQGFRWNGHDSNGILLEQGVYVYQFQIKFEDGNTMQIFGDVTLIH